MFSAFKKLTGGGGSGGQGQPQQAPHQIIPQQLQRKFAKGVHYNMKVVIRGDRNVGKSTLFRRLQGLPFCEEYIATEEIAVTNITWNYKNSDDIVKVEVWDVVDSSTKKKRTIPGGGSQGLKLENSTVDASSPEVPESLGLDAATIDVYKGAHALLLVFDLTKAWTWDYVKKELPLVPGHLPILILGNRRDMGHHRAVATDTVIFHLEEVFGDDGGRLRLIRYAETSMRYGFGLKFVHKFFNVPYLNLQRETLLKQVKQNEEEMEVTMEELDLHGESEEANYDLFIDNVSQRRRQAADALSPPKLSLQEAQAVANAKALKEAKDEKEKLAAAQRLAVKSDPTQVKGPPIKGQLRGSEKNKSMQNGSGGGISPSPASPSVPSRAPSSASGQPGSLEDFVPEESNIQRFLEDAADHGANTHNANDDQYASSDDGEERENPMVAVVEEDIDNEIEELRKKIVRAPIISPAEQEPLSDKEDVLDESPTSQLPSKLKPGFQLFLPNEIPTTNSKTDVDIDLEEDLDHLAGGDSDRHSHSSSGKDKDKKKKKHHHHKKHKKDKDKGGSSSKDHNILEEFLGGDNGDSSRNAYEVL